MSKKVKMIGSKSVFIKYVIKIILFSAFSNNGTVLGIISIIPLCFYSLINTIIYTNNWLVFAVKFALMIILSAFFGNLSIKKRKKIRVK